MTVVDEGAGPSNGLVARVKNILLTPRAEWSRIDVEPATVQGLYTRYICILAAIPPLASLIGGLLFGQGIPGLVTYRPSPVFLISSAVVSYLLSLAAVAIVALIIEALAPSFGGTKNRVQAFKTAGYAYTAAWVAGILGIFPPLALIGLLLGLYSFYLLYLGLQIVMKSPADKAIGYTAVSVVVALVVYWIIAIITGTILMSVIGFGGMGATRTVADAGVVTVAGQRLDLGRMQAAARRVEAANAGKGVPPKAVSPQVLQAFLPGNLGPGFARTDLSSSTAEAGGFGGTTAEASYTRGDSSIRLNVTDMAAAGALAGIGSALNVSTSHESATGYEKVGTVDARMTSESYDRQSRSGKYGVVVGDRFMVQAEGDQIAMEDLKHAVAAVNPARLEALARG